MNGDDWDDWDYPNSLIFLNRHLFLKLLKDFILMISLLQVIYGCEVPEKDPAFI